METDQSRAETDRQTHTKLFSEIKKNKNKKNTFRKSWIELNDSDWMDKTTTNQIDQAAAKESFLFPHASLTS